MVESLLQAKELLYGQPLESFVAERDLLVKAVRSAGDRDLANAIKALRKPSAVAAEVNRVARADPDGVSLILQAAALLRDAQRGALEGSTINASELQQQYRAAISALAQTATSRKPEVRSALEAATIDLASNDDLRVGALVAVPTPDSIFGSAPVSAPSLPKANAAEPVEAPTTVEVDEVDEVAKQRAKRQAHHAAGKQAAGEKPAREKADQARHAKHLAAAEAAAAKEERARLKEEARARKQRKKERQQRRNQIAKEHRDAVRTHLTELEAEELASAGIDNAEARIVEIDEQIAELHAQVAALQEARPSAVGTRDAAQQSLRDQRERSAQAEVAVSALAELLDQIDKEDHADLD